MTTIKRTPKWEALDRTRGHMLLDQASIDSLPPLYASEDKSTDDVMIPVKLFSPYSSWTWYLLELDPEAGLAFALVDGHEREYGYVSVIELGETGRGALPLIERDLYWSPKTVAEITKEAA